MFRSVFFVSLLLGLGACTLGLGDMSEFNEALPTDDGNNEGDDPGDDPTDPQDDANDDGEPETMNASYTLMSSGSEPSMPFHGSREILGSVEMRWNQGI